MGLLLVVRSLGGGEGRGREVGKTGLEWDMLWIVLRAWPQRNMNRFAIIVGGTWATVRVLVNGQSVIVHIYVHTNSLSLFQDLSLNSRDSWGEIQCWRANTLG